MAPLFIRTSSSRLRSNGAWHDAQHLHVQVGGKDMMTALPAASRGAQANLSQEKARGLPAANLYSSSLHLNALEWRIQMPAATVGNPLAIPVHAFRHAIGSA